MNQNRSSPTVAVDPVVADRTSGSRADLASQPSILKSNNHESRVGEPARLDFDDRRPRLVCHWSFGGRTRGATILRALAEANRPWKRELLVEAIRDDGNAFGPTAGSFLSGAVGLRLPCVVPSHRHDGRPIRGLYEACLTEERLRLVRFPATVTATFLTPAGCAATPRPLTKVAVAALHFVPALSGAVRSSPVLTTAIEAAMSAARNQKGT
jgi:hypothetical protein